jgi:hypothetical protein
VHAHIAWHTGDILTGHCQGEALDRLHPKFEAAAILLFAP